MANAFLFSTGTELNHLHRLVTRIAAAGALASVVILFGIGVVTGEGHFFAEAIGPLLVTLALGALMALGREHAAVVFGLATLSVIVAHRFVGTAATTVAATTAIVVMGCLAVLFIAHRVVFYIAFGVVVNLFAPVFWSGELEGALSAGLVMALSFLVGSIAFVLVRNAAAAVNARYRTVFNHAPVPLIELDWEDALDVVDQIAPTSPQHLQSMLSDDRRLLRSIVAKIKVVRANDAAARLLSKGDSEAMVGPIAPQLVTSQLREMWIQQITAAWAHDREHEQEVHVELSGQERWLSIKTMSAADFDRSVVALSDVTASRLLEQSLTELIQSKDEFIASVSHELRTPLTAVVGLASELSTSNMLDTREKEELMEVLASQSVEMSHIVEDLLVAARADTGTITVAVEDVDLAEEARDLAAQLDPTVDVTGVASSAVAVADRVRARQILRNLLVNAARYGGDRRRVVVRTVNGSVMVEMRDDGTALSEEERNRIFQPYERAHEIAGVTAAVGLGLSVSQRLADLMDGSLVYDYDGEAVFRLELPAVSAANAANGDMRVGYTARS